MTKLPVTASADSHDGRSHRFFAHERYGATSQPTLLTVVLGKPHADTRSGTPGLY